MVHPAEDVPAIDRQEPTTGGDADGLWRLLADHWIDAGAIHKVSTLPKIVCQPIQPFLPMIFFQLPHLSCWTVAQHLVPKQPNETHVTDKPEMDIDSVMS